MRPFSLTRLALPGWVFVVAIFGTTLSLFHHHHGVAVSGFVLLAATLFGGAMLLDALRLKHQRLADRLRDLIVGDDGAGLLDRRGLEHVLGIEVERAGRSGIRFAVIF